MALARSSLIYSLIRIVLRTPNMNALILFSSGSAKPRVLNNSFSLIAGNEMFVLRRFVSRKELRACSGSLFEKSVIRYNNLFVARDIDGQKNLSLVGEWGPHSVRSFLLRENFFAPEKKKEEEKKNTLAVSFKMSMLPPYFPIKNPHYFFPISCLSFSLCLSCSFSLRLDLYISLRRALIHSV